MRDMGKHPITREEVIDCLDTLQKEMAAENRAGDMRPILLKTAADILRNPEILLKDAIRDRLMEEIRQAIVAMQNDDANMAMEIAEREETHPEGKRALNAFAMLLKLCAVDLNNAPIDEIVAAARKRQAAKAN
jgi:hypothetical protein